MSRLPLPTTWDPKSENKSCHFFESDIGSAVTSAQIRQKTRVDPVISRVHSYTVNGWPTQISYPQFMPYSVSKAELSVEHGCVLLSARVIVNGTEVTYTFGFSPTFFYNKISSQSSRAKALIGFGCS